MHNTFNRTKSFLFLLCSFREEFRYLTKNVVLATGSYDRPNLLSVPGEDLPFVVHSLKDFEGVLSSEQNRLASDPVLMRTCNSGQTFLGV